MTSAEMLASLASIAVGMILGRLLDRSGFSMARAFAWDRVEAPDVTPEHVSVPAAEEAFRAYWLALGLLWVFAALAPRAFSREFAQALVISPLAAMLAGFVSGLALRMLDADPLTLAVGAGGMRAAS